jgi:hypothetical protein
MLRVSAVKELPALSRMRDVGLLDCEGASDDARVADGPGSGCSPVVEVKRVVITGDPIQIKVPGVCLGGCIMHVKSRRVYERRLRPQTGCLVQRLSCYSGECRHGDSAAPRRRTLHRQVSCRLRKPDWRPCTQPGWSGGRGGSRQSRQSRPGPGEIEDDDRQHPPGRGHGDLPVGRCAQREAFRSASSVRSSRGRHLYSNLLPGPDARCAARSS